MIKPHFLNYVLSCLLVFSACDIFAAAPAKPQDLRVVENLSSVPADRLIPWRGGVPDGIPTYAIGVDVKDFGAVGNGVADDYAAIMNAIANCPDYKAVYFPAGTYKIGQQITLQNDERIVFRGAGTQATKLVFTSTQSGGFAGFQFRGWGSGTFANLTQTANKGDTQIHLSSAAAFKVGDYIRIEHPNDPTVVEGDLPGSVNYQAQLLSITDKVGNVIHLSRPLYYTYKINLGPSVNVWRPIRGCGVEDMHLDMQGSLPKTVFFYRSAECWVRGVESINCNWHHVAFDSTLNCEVRNSFFHHAHTYGQGGYGMSIGNNACDTLVEDNIFYYLRHSVVIQNGAKGNIVAYNHSSRMFDKNYPNTQFLMPDIECHGGHPYMNLIEGNICVQLMCDNFWGSSSHNMFLRNHATRHSLGEGNNVVVNSLRAVRLDAENLYESFIGNVLGSPGDTGEIWFLGRDNGRLRSIPHGDAGWPVDDPRVEQTLFRNGNFDFVSGSTQWDSSHEDRSIPNSLYLTSKPSFFGQLAWPPFGPSQDDSSPVIGKIPAQVRYENMPGTP